MNKNEIQIALQKYRKRFPLAHNTAALPAKEGFQCVLFDMDGVLYDSMPNHVKAWNRSMQEFGIQMNAADAYATEGARGIDTIRNFAQKQLGKHLSQEEAQHIYDVKTKYFHEMPQARIFPGVMELMQKIKTSGLTIGVVTGSGQRPLIRQLLQDFTGFLDRDHIVTAYDVERGKPYPDPYLTGLKKTGNFEPWQGIVVENAPLGVRSGVSAHIFTVAINSGPLPDSALQDEGANLVYSDMTQFCADWNTLLSLSRSSNERL